MTTICGKCGELDAHCKCHPDLPETWGGDNRHSEHFPSGKFAPDETPDDQTVHVKNRTRLEIAAGMMDEACANAMKQIAHGADKDFQIKRVDDAMLVLVRAAMRHRDEFVDQVEGL